MSLFYRKLPRFEYLAPSTPEEALELLAKYKGKAKLLAGGTDLIPRLKGRTEGIPEFVIDLKSIKGLDTISFDERSGLKIGPLVTIRAIAESEAVKDNFPCLSQAADKMASPQVRNRGTFAGNICSAVPSADSAPPLLALGASVKIKGPGGERAVPLDRFFTGPRRTILKDEEMLTEISVPKPAPGCRSIYLKLSPRHSMDLAVAGVAAAGACEGGICKDIKIALGAVAPVPVRAGEAEKFLLGQRITPEIIDKAAANAVTECSPIDDHRASREYRCDMIYVMTRRALVQIFFK